MKAKRKGYTTVGRQGPHWDVVVDTYTKFKLMRLSIRDQLKFEKDDHGWFRLLEEVGKRSRFLLRYEDLDDGIITEMNSNPLLSDLFENRHDFSLADISRFLYEMMCGLKTLHAGGISECFLQPLLIFSPSSSTTRDSSWKIGGYGWHYEELTEIPPWDMTYYSLEQLEGGLSGITSHVYSVGIMVLQMIDKINPLKDSTDHKHVLSRVIHHLINPPPKNLTAGLKALRDFALPMVDVNPKKRPSPDDILQYATVQAYGSIFSTASPQQSSSVHVAAATSTVAGEGAVVADQTYGRFNEKHGSYVLKRLIGHGAHGSVYLAENDATKETRAIKIIPYNPNTNSDTGADSEEKRKSIRNTSVDAEMQIGAAFGRKCVYLVEYEEIRRRPAAAECVIIMEYCGGGELRSHIESHTREKIAFSEDELLRLLFEVGTAIYTLHVEGVVHCDIKPENIFLLADGTYKLGDYGIARFVSSRETVSIVRTEGYAAPEVLEGSGDYDLSIDVYALGCILLEMIALHHPFRNEKNKLNIVAVSMGKVNFIDASRSPALLQLALRMVSVNPSDRPAMADVLSFAPLVAFLAAAYTARIREAHPLLASRKK